MIGKYRQPHPELLPGEIWLTNCFNEDDYNSIGWETKSKGTTPYDIYGEIINQGYPVFILSSERDNKFKETL